MAYVFDSEGELVYSLQQPNPIEYDRFGTVVTLLGDQPIVATNSSGTNGVVFVFDSYGQSFLTLEYPGSDSTNSGFGYPVAASVDLDLIVVGAPYEDHDAVLTTAGATYLFRASTGEYLGRLIAPTPESGENFGSDIVLSDVRILIGAKYAETGYPDGPGTVYVYNSTGTELLQTLTTPTQEDPSGGEFGSQLAASGDQLLVGAPFQSVDGTASGGAAYLYEWNSQLDQYELLRQFLSPTIGSDDRFGVCLGFVGDSVLVAEVNAGAGVVYRFDAATSDVLQVYTSPTGAPYFGGQFATREGDILIRETGTSSIYRYATAVTAQTDANGSYTFSPALPGSYQVGQILQAGYGQMAPGGDGTYELSVDDDVVTGLDFANVLDQWPIANNDSYDVNEGQTLTLEVPGVLSNDTDADVGDQLSAVLVHGTSHGNLTLNADGSFAYTPQVGFLGADTFAYKAQDQLLAESNVVTVSIDVNQVYDRTTFASTNVPLSIRDLSKVVSSIAVPASNSYTIQDLNVQLDITHTNDSDLDVFLIAPDGTTRVELFSDVGDHDDNFSGTVLDDESLSPITQSGGPFTGTFRPVGSLSDVDGLSAAGTWKLEIYDDAKSNRGTLNSWSITIAHEAAPLALSIDDVAKAEGAAGSTASFTFTVSLSKAMAGESPVTVNYATASGTATAGSDYTAAGGQLTFSPGGPLTQTVTVAVIGDAQREANETFVVNLSGAVGAEIVDGQGLGTIQNDDGRPPKQSVSSASVVNLVHVDSITSSEQELGATPAQQPLAEPIALLMPPAPAFSALTAPCSRPRDTASVDLVLTAWEPLEDVLIDNLTVGLLSP